MKRTLFNRYFVGIRYGISFLIVCAGIFAAAAFFRFIQQAQTAGAAARSVLETVQGSSESQAELTAPQAPGDLDTTFDGDGRVITDLGSGQDEAKAVAIQADGKIVVVGNGLVSGQPNIHVARYSATGVREMGFGGFYPNGSNPELGNAVALQADGRIVVAGGSNASSRVFRLNSSGQIDLEFAGAVAGEMNAIAIQADGKFVVAGYSYDLAGPNPSQATFTVIRYTTAGQRDPGFGTNGLVRVSFGGTHEYATTLKIDSNNNIVVGGYRFNSGGPSTDCAFARLLGTNGGLDNTFDGDGRRTVSIGSDGFGGNGLVSSIALTTDNKITAAISNTNSFTIARFNTDGAFDNTFDGNGMATANFGVSAEAKSLAIQTNGIIIVGASASNNFGLAAFNTNGTLDASFGTNGTITAAIGSNAVLNSLLIQPDRKIVAVGYTGTFGASADFAIARFLGNNTNPIIVTNTNDSGAGSLRQAILTANATPGLSNQIRFEIMTGTDPFTISPTTPLPTITAPVSIDGNFYDIILSGAALSSGSGLVLAGGNSTVKGMVINRFPGNGIHIINNGGNLIEYCNIGTNGAADTDLGNGLSGIRIETSGNTVGGFTSGLATAILGNNEHGVLIIGASASGNVIVNSSIGISPPNSPAGGTDIGNTFDGISIQSAPNNIIGTANNSFRNTISGNNRFGILIGESTASGNQVINNQIGTYNFDQDRGNSLSGIRIDKAPNNLITGGNIISGNDEHGVLIISDTAAFPASGNIVKGNKIGTDVNAVLDRGNTLDGVSIQTFAPNNIIGGAAAGEGNFISGNNRYGVFVGGNNGNTIKGNYIGTNTGGGASIGNSGNGIFLSSASNNIVGGILAGEKNLIAYNGDAGISLQDGTGNSFRGNSIFQNTGLGIELPAAGVNANDVGDGDTGSNNLQNYPVITGAATNGTIIAINGTLNSNANSTFHVDFYTNGFFFFDQCNGDPPLDYGEGKTYLGSGSTATNAGGNATFNFAFNAAVTTAQRITATATDANGNTSEFSRCVAPTVLRRSAFDFDGDGRADVSVFRPSSGVWYLLQSTAGFTGSAFGLSTDKIVPGDYDGDRKTDIAVWRPSTGFWYILNSSSGALHYAAFGQNGDIPTPADFDGDGKADLSVYRPADNYFYVLYSSDNSFHFQQWGQAGDQPVMGDYDGDGKNDHAIFRPSISTFYYLRSSTGVIGGFQWGAAGDKPISGDFDADGKTDIAVYRPSSGGWYALRSSDNGFFGVFWGTMGDVPAAADYDGDGKLDVAVFRPSIGTFYILQTTNNSLRAEQFGTSGDVPVPNAFVP